MRSISNRLAFALGLASFFGSVPARAIDITGSSAGISWSAATGPVSMYSVQVSRNGGAFAEATRIASRSARVSGVVGEVVRVRIAGVDVAGTVGPASTPSEDIRFIQAPPPPPPPPDPSGGEMDGDVDGDGMTDAVAYNTKTGELSVLLVRAGGVLEWESLGTPSESGMRPVGYADFDGDGQADLLWRNAETGSNELWHMDGLAYTLVALPMQDPSYRVASFRDFSNDGQADVLFNSPATGDSEVWTLAAAGRTAVLAVDPAPTNSMLTAVADLDGDTRPDLVWRDRTSGALEGWRMNGVAPTAIFSLPDAPQGGSLSGSGDFDGDGDEDLAWFVERSGKRSVHVWFVNGMSAPQMGVALRFGKKTRVRGVADADSDGRVEVITVRKGGFTATAVSPSADGIGADGATEWVTEATSLDGVPASRRWQFLVLQ